MSPRKQDTKLNSMSYLRKSQDRTKPPKPLYMAHLGLQVWEDWIMAIPGSADAGMLSERELTKCIRWMEHARDYLAHKRREDKK